MLWAAVPMVQNAKSSTVDLMTKMMMFVMLISISIMFCSLTSSTILFPPILPEKISNMDQVFGFMTSFFVLPLLKIAEDHRDYAIPSSTSPVNSAQSFSMFVKYSGLARFAIGMLLALTVAANTETNFIPIDPFQMLLVCIFTVTAVSSKMSAYLNKFTDSHFISILLPALISVMTVIGSGADIGQINTIANYAATFFAYQL